MIKIFKNKKILASFRALILLAVAALFVQTCGQSLSKFGQGISSVTRITYAGAAAGTNLDGAVGELPKVAREHYGQDCSFNWSTPRSSCNYKVVNGVEECSMCDAANSEYIYNPDVGRFQCLVASCIAPEAVSF
jgi:hypothetical protein